MALSSPLRTGNFAATVESLLPTPSKMRRCSVRFEATADAVPSTSSSCKAHQRGGRHVSGRA
eukprot:scaffold231191_cov40-Prasinocladus_malaysianus.AAC.2